MRIESHLIDDAENGPCFTISPFAFIMTSMAPFSWMQESSGALALNQAAQRSGEDVESVSRAVLPSCPLTTRHRRFFLNLLKYKNDVDGPAVPCSDCSITRS